MNVNVLKILENCPFFDFYFKNRNYILGTVIFFIIMILVVIVILKLDYENLWESLKRQLLIKEIIRIVVVLLVGMFFNVVGMDLKLKLKLNYMPMLLFFYGFILVTLIQFVEAVRYRATYIKIIKRTFNIYIGMVEAILLLLILMNRLEVIEVVVAIFSIITLKILDLVLDNKNINIESKGIKEDCPIEEINQLFDSRKRQLNSICEELNEFSKEHGSYAVAISGKWGSGKTSFVNVLEKEIQNAEFIHIECAIGYDAEAILNEMALQLIKKFKDNKVYVPQNGIIEQYFKKIAEFIGNMGYDKFSKILEGLTINGEQSYLEKKDLMNKELKNFFNIAKKNIYFIIDDMDRVIDNDMKIMLFQIVRECVELDCCVTLFMMDYDKLVSENMSKEFLEKYINYQYDLCELDFEEIIKKYLEVYLTDEYFANRSEYMSNRASKIRQYLLEKPKNIIDEISKLRSSLENNEEDGKYKEKIKWIKEIEEKLFSRINNPRKVKRYLDNIQKMIFIVDLVWFQNKNYEQNEYSKEPWTDYIIQISFLRAFLNETYEAMIQAGDLYILRNDEKNNFIKDQIISDYSRKYLMSGRYSEVVEELIYHLYILDVDLYKPQNQKLVDEIDKNNIKQEKILQYISICMGRKIQFDRLNIILDFLEKDLIEDKKYLSQIIMNIIENINLNEDNLRESEMVQTVKKIKNIINKYYSLVDKEAFESHMEREESKFIFKYNGYIIAVLETVYDDSDINSISSVNNMTQLCRSIKEINKNEKIIDIDENYSDNKIKYLKQYFKELNVKINEEKYVKAKQNSLYFLEPIEKMLEVLDILLENISNPFSERELDEIDFQNLDDAMKILLKIKNDAIMTDEDILNVRDLFIECICKIENVFDGYFIKEKKQLVEILYDIYDKLNGDVSVSRGLENQWNSFGLRLFKLYKNYINDLENEA